MIVVINAENLGVSEYALDAVDVLGGPDVVAWVALGDGVRALGGASAEVVACALVTGRQVFGDGQGHQACVEARLEGLAPAGAVVRTLSGELGSLVAREYTVPATAGTDVRGRRVRLGRGVRARSWAFAVANVDGGEVVVQQLAVAPVAGRPAR